VNAEFVRSILVERANFPCLAAKSAYKVSIPLSFYSIFDICIDVYSIDFDVCFQSLELTPFLDSSI